MYTDYLFAAIEAALLAGKAINKIYKEDFSVDHKADESPLTLADTSAHQIILERLAAIFPVLSEEGKTIPYSERKHWTKFWMVDPLDGTKEFIKKNDEFTVNIALIIDGRPVLGVVYAPALSLLYFAAHSFGAFKAVITDNDPITNLTSLRSRALPLPCVELPVTRTIVASRSHSNEQTTAFVEAEKQKHGDVNLISKGSSLKICLVAEGSAHVYPRLGPTMEWDTAAADAVSQFAGCQLTNAHSGTPLFYNKEDLLNPSFIVSC